MFRKSPHQPAHASVRFSPCTTFVMCSLRTMVDTVSDDSNRGLAPSG